MPRPGIINKGCVLWERRLFIEANRNTQKEKSFTRKSCKWLFLFLGGAVVIFLKYYEKIY